MLLLSPRVLRTSFLFSTILALSAPSAFALNWDRFTEEASREVLKTGKYKGEAIEIGQRRALVFLTPEEKAELKIPVDQLAFANFRHNQIFYVATIPGIYVDAQNRVVRTDEVVDHIGFSEKHWAADVRPETSSLEAHSELVFHPTKDHSVTLVANQDAKKILPKMKALLDPVVLSVEAVRSQLHKDASFFPDATGPNFAIVHRIVSDHERDIQHRGDPDRKIVSNILNFDQTRVKAVIANDGPVQALGSVMDTLLVAALNRSVRLKRTEVYDMARNNCTNNLFHLFDDVLDYNAGINKNEIRKGVKHFIQVELPKIREFFVKQKQVEEVLKDPALKAAFDGVTTKLDAYSKSKLTDAELDDAFMSSMPAFIRPHLRARGILVER